MNKPKVGDTIKIIYMDGEPRYTNKIGIIKSIDDMGQLHTTAGGLAVVPGTDIFEIIGEADNERISL